MNYLVPKKQEIEFDGKIYPIFELPGRQPAMLDKHLAEIFQVKTKHLNEAYKNNPGKFLDGWVFQPTKEELLKVENLDLYISQPLTYIPHFYSWEGSNMVATILKSDVAKQRAIQIIQGFTTVEKTLTKFADDPMMQMAQQTMQCVINHLEMKEKLKQQEKRIDSIEAKQDAILRKDGFYSIVAYANLTNKKVTKALASKLGKEATRLSKKYGIMTGKVVDDRWGHVNSYHETILEKVFSFYFD